MKHLIQVSLSGNGRILILTPETVRKAFFQFTSLNRLAWQDKSPFEHPSTHDPEITLRDILHRDCWVDKAFFYLSQRDIQWIERQINRLLLEQELVLVEGEKCLDYGYIGVRRWGQSREKVHYIVRYGMIFILAPLRRDALSMHQAFWIERYDKTIQYVYYEGTKTDLLQSRLVLQFRNPFHLSETWTIPVAEFKIRRLFHVKKVIACEGFRLITPKNEN
jgi:hypothetical protein